MTDRTPPRPGLPGSGSERTAGEHPPDEFERYILEEYFPKLLPAMAGLEPVDRAAPATFEDGNGVQCEIPAAELACCFLALDDLCLIPEISPHWRNLIPKDLWPETMFRRPAPADPHQGAAQLTAIELQENPEGCPCCGARCHFVFRCGDREHRIEQWSVIAAIRLLASQHALPMLPPSWEARLSMHYEHIGKTGVRILQKRHGRLQDL